jgi:predicted TIM-barrel fold metal-dependent hydrolase
LRCEHSGRKSFDVVRRAADNSLSQINPPDYPHPQRESNFTTTHYRDSEPGTELHDYLGEVMKSQMYSLFLLVIFASIGLAQRTALAQTNLWIETNTTAQSSTLSEKKAQPQPTAQMRPPIIDVHMHAFENDERWNQRVPNPVNGQPMNATNEQAHMRATIAEMKKYNVVKAIASADYQAVLRWKAEAPDNIISSYSFFDPTTVDLEFLRKEHSAGRLSAIGEVAAQYQGLAPNDPKMEPIYALAEELDIPLGIHIGLSKPGVAYDDSPKYRAALSNPMVLEEVLLRHPKLRLYVMHAGWPMLDQMVALLWAHPQVYVDVAVIDWAVPRAEFHSYLKRLVDAGFGKRIMFGSDQMVWPEAIGMAIEGIESAAFLNEQQKRDIFYNNAVKFLRLDKR